MKKLILFLLFFTFASVAAQSRYTLEQIDKTNDPQVIANFITTYPNHPKSYELKRKLATMQRGNTPNTTASPYTKKGAAQSAASKREHQRAAEEVTRILNGSSAPISSEAYVTVKNQSQCPIIVSFTGKTKHHLEVPAHTTKRILLTKGNYNISSSICGARYQNTKNITSDYIMALGVK